ncbi:MAG: endodeoxyribonuclease RusA [Streptosporangiaceae bacterium]|nr:endodeoxyribonuclease RusA [Streptosporangiaceae bacterium]
MTLTRPRSWRIELPAGMFLLNDNQRLDRRRKAEHIAVIRQTTAYTARHAKLPELERAHVFYVVHPDKKTRSRDPGNWSPSAKAAIDGLVDAGLLPDDNSTRLLGPDPRLGTARAKTQMALVITDLTSIHPDHLALLNPPGDLT